MTERICDDCGLPLSICNAKAMVRIAVERHGPKALSDIITVQEAAKVLVGLDVSLLIEATDIALHDMGTPHPATSEQYHRDYFRAVIRAITAGDT